MSIFKKKNDHLSSEIRILFLHELQIPGEIVQTKQATNLSRFLLENRPEYRKREHSVIFLHDNVPGHTENPVRGTLETFSWEVLSPAAYSTDLDPSDYKLFTSMGSALICWKIFKKWPDGKTFTGVALINCPKDGVNV